MQLLIDATIVRKRITGTERYTLEITKELVPQALALGYKVIILLPHISEDLNEVNLSRPNLEVKRSPFKSRLLTEQVWLPWVVKCIDKTFLFFPAIPPSPLIYFVKRRNILCKTVYDAVMWRHPETLSWKNKYHLRPLETFWINRYDIIHTISEYSKKEINELFPITEGRTINSSIGIDFDKYSKIISQEKKNEIKNKYDLPDKYILFVGTLDPRKNIKILIESMSLLIKNDIKLKLVIVGRFGWGANEVKKHIDNYNIKECIKVIGSVQDSDLPSIYSLASILVFPSFYEGFGLPVIEAMASGTPVIASNSSSIPEAAGSAAILLDPYDVHAWVDAICRVLSDKKLSNKMIYNGYIQAKIFKWENVSGKILQSFHF